MVSNYSCDCNASFLLSPSFWTWIKAHPVGVLACCDRVCRGVQAFHHRARYAPLIIYTKKLLTGLLFWLPEAHLVNELKKTEHTYPRHLIILAGSLCQDNPAPAPSTFAPTGGILARYQLLTPALITGLLLTFFVLVPVVLFGISTLASIQSPLRVQAAKGYSADKKKNQ
jgi:hypothetical protein